MVRSGLHSPYLGALGRFLGPAYRMKLLIALLCHAVAHGLGGVPVARPQVVLATGSNIVATGAEAAHGSQKLDPMPTVKHGKEAGGVYTAGPMVDTQKTVAQDHAKASGTVSTKKGKGTGWEEAWKVFDRTRQAPPGVNKEVDGKYVSFLPALRPCGTGTPIKCDAQTEDWEASLTTRAFVIFLSNYLVYALLVCIIGYALHAHHETWKKEEFLKDTTKQPLVEKRDNFQPSWKLDVAESGSWKYWFMACCCAAYGWAETMSTKETPIRGAPIKFLDSFFKALGVQILLVCLLYWSLNLTGLLIWALAVYGRKRIREIYAIKSSSMTLFMDCCLFYGPINWCLCGIPGCLAMVQEAKQVDKLVGTNTMMKEQMDARYVAEPGPTMSVTHMPMVPGSAQQYPPRGPSY